MTEDIWEIVFQTGKPVSVAFHNSEVETSYIFEYQGDDGIYVRDPERKRVMFIPWASIDYLAWNESTEEKQGGEKKRCFLITR